MICTAATFIRKVKRNISVKRRFCFIRKPVKTAHRFQPVSDSFLNRLRRPPQMQIDRYSRFLRTAQVEKLRAGEYSVPQPGRGGEIRPARRIPFL